ncbi:MAG TPA: PP2C family protein-serine/threonine phosphatase [Candidatus Sulfotelmatobacter sp.]|nr:PP2C family protein-serine/threonine phosphatase [Candidatus Sulfotelmatobacter sp.]
MRSLFRSRDPEPAVIVEPAPTVFPVIQGADIAAVFAGKRVAGDFYDSIRVSPQRVLIGLLDIAGRREDNRHLLTAAQQIFRNAGCELFSRPDINESDAMTELNHLLNRGLIDASKGVRSCPAFIACYHEVFGTLCYTNAGHIPGLLRDATGISELDSTGLPLGLFSHATADARIVALEKRAALLLVSRGLIACEGRTNGSSDEFSLDRVKPIFQNTLATGAQALCSSILNSVNDFGGHVPLCDDRTALALIRTA